MVRAPVKLALAATFLALVVLSPAVALPQATVSDFMGLPQEKKFYFVSGYLDGFAVAAQIPERAASLQKCLQDLGTQKTLSLFEAWAKKHPDADTTARTGLFSAVAEACGWKKR